MRIPRNYPQPAAKGYHIPASSAPSAAVEAWSTARLPFEATGWKLDFRRDLRAAVQLLAAPPDTCLHAVYTSLNAHGCDAENALFYNVGPAAFARGMANGVRFERTTAKAPACPIALNDSGTQDLHHYSYAFAPCDTSWQFWQTDAVLAIWAIPLEAFDLRSCAAVWRAMKRKQLICPLVHRAAASQPFGLRLWLQVPDGSALRLHTVLKPLLDGVISALHQHSGTPADDVCAHLTAGPHINVDKVREWLTDSTPAILGPRERLVESFRAGVKWNPQDDLCAAADIRITRGQRPMTLRGEIVTLRRNAEGETRNAD